MKKTPIKRKTPLRRASKPMRRVSKRRAGENREYSIVRMRYLMEHPWCEACKKVRPIMSAAFGPGASTEIHHFRGKLHRLLNDSRFFLAVCRECHDFIHDNGYAARRLGLLAPISEFNVYPEDK